MPLPRNVGWLTKAYYSSRSERVGNLGVKNFFAHTTVKNYRVGDQNHPMCMPASTLVATVVSAAREGNRNPNFWRVVGARAQQIWTSLGTLEEASFLSSYVKSGHADTTVLEYLLPFITKNLPNYSELHFAMVVASVARTPLRPKTFLDALNLGLQQRLHEFQTPTALSMLLSGLVKLGIQDKEVLKRISSHIKNRLRIMDFPIRDLSVITCALSRTDQPDPALFDLIAEQALSDIRTATALEMARFIGGFARVNHNAQILLIETAVPLAVQKLTNLNPEEIVHIAYAFGVAGELATSDQSAHLKRLFDALLNSFVRYLKMYEIGQVSNVLHSLSRWKVYVSAQHFHHILSRLNTYPDNVDLATRAKLCRSLSVIARPFLEQKEKGLLIELFAKWEPLFNSDFSNGLLCFREAVNVVRSCTLVGYFPDDLLKNLHAQMVWRYKELSPSHCTMLLNILQQRGFNPDDDCLLLLKQRTERLVVE